MSERQLIFKSTFMKADTPDSNGRIYSKEAMEKAIKDFLENHKDSNVSIDHPDSVSFDIAWNDKFEESVVEEMFHQLRGKPVNVSLINKERLLEDVKQEFMEEYYDKARVQRSGTEIRKNI